MMDRNEKVFLCVKSLLNVSQDLKEEYSDFSDMLLFMADKISAKEQGRMEKKSRQVHGEGKVHDLGSKYICTCGEGEECDKCELDIIEKKIDEMISTVRKELVDVSD